MGTAFLILFLLFLGGIYATWRVIGFFVGLLFGRRRRRGSTIVFHETHCNCSVHRHHRRRF